MGGLEALKDQRFAFIFLDHPYGKEPIPTFDILAEKFGFTYDKYPVPFATGTEQKSLWLQIRRTKPAYIIMWGWGVMNATAVKEAANIKFDMSKFIGNWWSASEPSRAAGRRRRLSATKARPSTGPEPATRSSRIWRA